MSVKKFAKIFFVFLIILTASYIIKQKYFKKNKLMMVTNENENLTYNSNILKDVEYSTKDEDGNEYLIKALNKECLHQLSLVSKR